MIIALTGTPGTGKTSVASIVEKQYEISIINLHQFAKDNHLIDGFDTQRNSDIIDIDLLNKEIQQQIKTDGPILLDGHLSHLLSCVSKIIVLRCHPEILQKRLQIKKWHKEKIQENIHAEILDVIISETVNNHSIENIFELDTSQKNTMDIAKIIIQLIQTDFNDSETYTLGKIDWSELILSDKFSWSNDR